MQAFRREKRSMSPLIPSTLSSRVWVGSQFRCGNWISLVSSSDTTFAFCGMKRETAFIIEVLPLAVPPTTRRLFRCSMASQRKARVVAL
jgi:hypothetical protein